MKSLWIAGAAVAVSAMCGVAGARDQGIDALTALGGALRSADAWRADYTQEYIAAGMSAGEAVAGVVTVGWPDRALFKSGDPVTQMMGLEGRTVRLVDLEVPSCDEHLLGDDEWARVPLAAVLDPSGAVEHFAVFDHSPSGFTLVPHEPGGVDRVEVTLNENSLPLEVVIVDPQGATNRLTFTQWTAADSPAQGRWLPAAPAGLECIVD
jgi:hypothetical protein